MVMVMVMVMVLSSPRLWLRRHLGRDQAGSNWRETNGYAVIRW
jgi:hypothetical protein